MNLRAACRNCAWNFSDNHWDTVLVASGSHSLLEYHVVVVTGLGVGMTIESHRRSA